MSLTWDTSCKWNHTAFVCDGLVSLRKSSKFIWVVVMWQHFLPFLRYSIVLLSSLIHSSINGHLGCFQVLPTGNTLRTWVGKHLLKTLLSIILDIYPQVGLDHMAVLSFWRNSILFSIVLVPFYNPINNAYEFQLQRGIFSFCIWWLMMLTTSSHSLGPLRSPESVLVFCQFF